MRKMVIAWIFLAIVLSTSLYFIGLTVIKEYKPYRELEADMVESATLYLEMKNLGLKLKEKHKIESDKLIENGVLTSMKVEDDECNGYVIVQKNLDSYDYKAYIKCQNYTTEDYKE